jgi:hypothetical protein
LGGSEERDVRGAKTSCVLLAAVMATGLGLAAPAEAAEPGHGRTNARCSLVGTVTASPGASLTSRSSNVEGSGTIACAGTFYGHRVTGPGTYKEKKAVFTGTCVMAHASAWFSAVIATVKGSLRVSGPFKENFVGVGNVFVVYLPRGARLTGVSAGQPLPGKHLAPGTCVTPVTNAAFERIAFATDRRN